MQLILLKQIRHCDKKFHFTQFSLEILRVIETPLLSKRVLCYILIIVIVIIFSATNNKDFTKGQNAWNTLKQSASEWSPSTATRQINSRIENNGPTPFQQWTREMKLSAIIRQPLACFHATVISWFNYCYCCVHCRVESCQYKGMYVCM